VIIESKKHGVFHVKVDTEDVPRIRVFRWAIAKHKEVYYAASYIGGRKTGDSFGISMHRLITSFENEITDHKNRCGIDNRKENLRGCTYQENKTNSVSKIKSKFGYIGVSDSSNPSGKFRARIEVNGRQKSGGTFRTAIEAARAYDIMALKYFGEFANLNFKEEKVMQ
jgi:hypothetical protein